MTTKTSLRLFAAVMVGFGVGAYVGSEYLEGHGSAAAPAAPLASTEEIADLRSEVARLRATLASQPVASTTAGTARESATAVQSAPTAWQLLADLQQRKLATPGITFVAGSGKLTDAFANLFMLDDAERATLQRGLDQACDQLADLQRRNAMVSRGDDGSVSIKIKSFAVDGGVVYDQLMKGFAQTLGADRNAAFVKLGGEQVERALGRFGAPDYEYTFRSKPRSGPGGATFEVSEKHKLPHESGSSNSTFRTWTEVQNRLGPVARLVPPDFAQPE